MNELKDLEVDEISLVDAGANPQANILLIKRKGEQDMNKKDKAAEVVTQEQVSKEAETQTVDVEKDALQKRVAELEKQLADRDAADKAAIDKAAADKAAADNKTLAETLERLNQRMEEHIEKAEDAALMKVAEKYEIIGEKKEDTFKLLKSVKGTDSYDLLIGTFDKALAAIKKAGTFEEVGKTGYGSLGSRRTKIEKLADEIQKADPTLSRRFAIEKVFEQHPELEEQ